MTRDAFPDGVAQQLKWYVYRLIDPRNGETFYVGKGQGNRVFDHARGLTLDEESEIDGADPKLQRVKDILAAGLEVGHVIHRHGIGTSKTALEVEAALIDAYPGLTNRVRGHGSRDFGSRHVEEIINEYAGEEFQVKERTVLISIGVYYYLRDDPYDAVRYSWKINQSRVNGCNLVLARVRRLIVGAYRPLEWLPATRDNFPDLAKRFGIPDAPGRKGFVGEPADAEVWGYYVNKRVPKRFISQSPVRYLEPGA